MSKIFDKIEIFGTGSTSTSNGLEVSSSAGTINFTVQDNGDSITRGSFSANSLNVSGTTQLGSTTATILNVSGLSQLGSTTATTLSAGTIYSGNTDLYNIFTKGSGTIGNIPLWSGTNLLGNSSIIQSGNVVSISANLQVNGNFDVLGTATTFNTQTVSTTNNRIFLNLSGSYASSFGGGIIVLSGHPSGEEVSLTVNSLGDWSANTKIIAGDGLDIPLGSTNPLSSGGTDLYNIFSTIGSGGPDGSGFSGWTSSTGVNSIILNNSTNIASNNFSLAGGFSNSATSTYSVVVGGSGNTASGVNSFVGGGGANSAIGQRSFVGAGSNNIASGGYSVVVGGNNNKAIGLNSFVGGGTTNSATTTYSIVVGGFRNKATAIPSIVFGGYSNTASGRFSSVLNGSGNTASGFGSAVLAGSGHTVSGTQSVIIGGRNINASSNDTVYVPFLNINSASTSNSLTNVLVRDTSGFVFLRDASTISGAGNFLPISGGTVTGDTIFTTNVSANTLSLTTTSSAAPINFPIFTSNPSSPNNGDAWIFSANTGNAIFSIRIGGVTKTVELT